MEQQHMMLPALKHGLLCCNFQEPHWVGFLLGQSYLQALIPKKVTKRRNLSTGGRNPNPNWEMMTKHTPGKFVHTGWGRKFSMTEEVSRNSSSSSVSEAIQNRKKISIHPHLLFKIHTKLKVHGNTFFLLQAVITELLTSATHCQGLLDFRPPRHHCFCMLTTPGQIPHLRLPPLAPARPPWHWHGPSLATWASEGELATLAPQDFSGELPRGPRHHLGVLAGHTKPRQLALQAGWAGRQRIGERSHLMALPGVRHV